MVSATLNDRCFSVEDTGFIDAEKISLKNNIEHPESEFCWAAAASNVLWYTGWAGQVKDNVKARFTSEDDVLDMFVNRFSNGGSLEDHAIRWFFNGYYEPYYENSDVAKPLEGSGKPAYREFTGFLKDYAADSVMKTYDIRRFQRPQYIRDALADLRAGAGITVGIGWIGTNGERVGGHAVTLWGYVRKDGADTGTFAKDNYVALIISDSDSDPVDGLSEAQKYAGQSGRRAAPNKLRILYMSAEDNMPFDSWLFDYADGSYDGILESFVRLEPYSESVQKDGGTKNSFDDPNIVPWMLSVSESAADCASAGSFRTMFAPGELFVCPSFWNTGEADCSAERIPFQVELLDSAGETVSVEGQTYYSDITLESRWYSDYESDRVSLGTLDAGTYTVRVTVNPENGSGTHTITESYYTDNTAELTFTVKAGYDTSAAYMTAGCYELESSGEGSIAWRSVTIYDVDQIGSFTTAGYMMSVSYYDEDGDPLKIAGYSDLLDYIPYARLSKFGASAKIRLLIRPSDYDMPWVALETPVLLNGGGTLGEIPWTFDLFERKVTIGANGVPTQDRPVYIAGYDDFGRMAFLSELTGAGQAVLSEDTAYFKLFWINAESSAPQCAAVAP